MRKLLVRTKAGTNEEFRLTQDTITEDVTEVENHLIVKFQNGKGIYTSDIVYRREFEGIDVYQTKSGTDYILFNPEEKSRVRILSSNGKDIPRNKDVNLFISSNYEVTIKTWKDCWEIGKIESTAYSNGVIRVSCEHGSISFAQVI